MTFEPIPREVLESAALDYSKWGLLYGREATQEFFRQSMGIPEGSVFPDITNKFYQEYLLKKIAALKKAGVKCVWLDALFTQANIAYRITRNYNHPAVKEDYMAAVNLVKKIKAMGIMVGTWSDWAVYSYKEVPPVDFVTKTVEVNEVLSLQINISKWREVVKLVKSKVNATVLMVFDFSPSDNTPLAVFSQKLSPEQQKKFLKAMHNACIQLNIVPVYPVHGGYMGQHATKLSYRKYKFYDAKAPEFKTYQTIKTLTRH